MAVRHHLALAREGTLQHRVVTSLTTGYRAFEDEEAAVGPSCLGLQLLGELRDAVAIEASARKGRAGAPR